RVFGTDTKTGIHEVRYRSGTTRIIGFEIHEFHIFDFLSEVIVLVPSDWIICLLLRQAAPVSDLFWSPWISDVVALTDKERVNYLRRICRRRKISVRMCEPNSIVSELQAFEQVKLASAPYCPMPVLVGGKIFKERHDALAVWISRIHASGMIIATYHAKCEIGRLPTVEHHPIEIRMRDVAPKLSEGGTARPCVPTNLCIQELAGRVLRQGEPKSDLI